MKAYGGADTAAEEVKEREGKIAKIMNRLEQLENFSEEVEAKLNSFSEELFGFVHDTKRVDNSIEKGNCGMIQYRILNISSILNGMSIELNAMLNELPGKVEQ